MSAWTLYGDRERKQAIAAILAAPPLYRVELREKRRSDEQNKRLWAMVSDIWRQHGDWFGPDVSREDIKHIFMSALGTELRVARSADGRGYIPLGRRSSKLSVADFSALIELLFAWGADPAHQVTWTDPKIKAEEAERAQREALARQPERSAA